MVAFVWSTQATAQIVFLADRPVPQARLVVGPASSAVDEVVFNVPATQVGSGAAIAGDISVRFLMRARFTSPQPMSITIDSTDGLNSGGNSIPVTELSWTSAEGDIPAGSFDGSSSQVLYSFNTSQRLSDTLSFSYNNTSVPAAGSYTGRVTYTVVLP